MPSELNWFLVETNNESARIVSQPDHSYAVHYGESRADGTMTPSRGYMSAAATEFPLEEVFATEYQQTGSFRQAFIGTGEALLEEVKGQITDEKWDWDRATVRSDGSVVGSPRDVRDTGELLNGQILEVD